MISTKVQGNKWPAVVYLSVEEEVGDHLQSGAGTVERHLMAGTLRGTKIEAAVRNKCRCHRLTQYVPDRLITE